MNPTTTTGFRLDDGQIEVVEPFVAKCLQRRTFAGRLELVFDANRTMQMLIAARVKMEHPDWSTEQIQAEVSRRVVYGNA